MDKIEKLLKSKAIKMHLFLPSKRRLFTIISNNEYWLDLNINFCSCKGYYYKYMRNNEQCYHLKALSIAKESEMDIIKFDDKEYSTFLYTLLRDLTRYALNKD